MRRQLLRSSSVSSSLFETTRQSKTTTSTSRFGRSRSKATAESTKYRENEIICAVSEARGISPTAGVTFVNVTTCEAVLCQFADTQTFARVCHKIQVFSPTTLLYAKPAEDTKFISILHANLDPDENDIELIPIERRFWSESTGHDYLRQLAFPAEYESLKLAVAGNFFAVCCFGAALRYAEVELHTTFVSQSLRIKFEPSEGAMMIDLATSNSLELVQNLHDARSKDCLFGLLNETLTRMGARILKSNILQPSTDKSKLLKRFEAVAELSNKENIFYAVREALQGMVDTDKVLANLIIIDKKIDFPFAEQSVNKVLMLKSFIESIPPVWQGLTGVQSEELLTIRDLCDASNYTEIKDLIEYALNDNVRYSTKPTELRNQQVFAIKSGVNGFLDVARQTYNEISKDVYAMADELKDEHNIGLLLKYDPARQFYFKIKSKEIEDRELPAIFINLHQAKGVLECQTMELLKMNQRIKDSYAEVIAMSDQSIQELINAVRPKLHPLFKISEGIAMLDLLAGFAQLVIIQNYVRPEFGATLAVKNARHPILDKIHRTKLIPNDVYATEQNRFQIITGCNMSGKSTYIRTIALITVMAQVGCFVPAEFASFPIIHQMFARVSTDDSIEANVSTFSSEMREMAFILHNIEPRSLVIVDELGRGTSTNDGLAIALAISEALIDSKALVWFVTHFRDIPRILAERPGVVNLHLSVDIAPDFSRMKMMYRISDGYEEQKYYGLALASLLDFPQALIDTAAEISQALNARNEARKQNIKSLAIAKKRKLALKLQEQLIQATESDADGESLRIWLKKLQEEFIIRMTAIDAEVAAAETATEEQAEELSEMSEDVDQSMTHEPQLGHNEIDEQSRHGDVQQVESAAVSEYEWSDSFASDRIVRKVQCTDATEDLNTSGHTKDQPIELSSDSLRESTASPTSPATLTMETEGNFHPKFLYSKD